MYGMDMETQGYAAADAPASGSYSEPDDLGAASLAFVGFAALFTGGVVGYLGAESHLEDDQGNRVYTDGALVTHHYVRDASGEYVRIPSGAVQSVADNALGAHEDALLAAAIIGFAGTVLTGGHALESWPE